MQSNIFSNEGDLTIHFNLSQYNEGKNNLVTNIIHKSHASNHIKESKLEDQIISHDSLDIDDSNIFHCKLRFVKIASI